MSEETYSKESEESKSVDEDKDFESDLNKSTIYANNLRLAKSYNFQAFDIAKDLEKFKNFNCIITSKTNSGKSVLLNDLVYRIRKWYSKIYVFSMTSYLQPDLFNYVPKENIIPMFDEEKLRHIWEQQEELILKLRKTKIKEDDMPRILILYDDLISDPKVKNSPMLRKMFVAARHCKISQFFLTQSFTAIPPVLRKNVALAIAFYLDNYADREAFAKSYLSTKNVKLGIMIFDQLTKVPYQAVCVLNCMVDSQPDHYIKTFIASMKTPKFSVGGDHTTKSMVHSVNFGMPSPASEGYGMNNGQRGNMLGLNIARRQGVIL